MSFVLPKESLGAVRALAYSAAKARREHVAMRLLKGLSELELDDVWSHAFLAKLALRARDVSTLEMAVGRWRAAEPDAPALHRTIAQLLVLRGQHQDAGEWMASAKRLGDPIAARWIDLQVSSLG